MFNVVNGVLEIRKINIPKLNINIMDDIQQAYRHYIDAVVLEDMDFLLESIRDTVGMENVGLSVKVGKLQALTYAKTQIREGNFYYPVIGTFTLNGQPVGKDWELLRIPYMDDYGRINVDGRSKVILIIQRSADDVSYSMKTHMFNISMPHANMRIYDSAKSIKMAFGTDRIPLQDVISFLLMEAGDATKISDVIKNTLLIKALKVNPLTSTKYASESLVSTKPYVKKIVGQQYKLGTTRDALNEILTLDRAIGYTLSQPVLSYDAGTVITPEMVQEFKRNRVNVVFVQNFFMPKGYLLAEPNPLIFGFLPAGMRVGSFIRQHVPECADKMVVENDIRLDNNPIIIPNNVELTEDMIEFLISCGYTQLKVCTQGSKSVIVFSFEREIVGNYTAKLSELTNNIPDGRFADEWVYYYNNPNLDRIENDTINAHDLLAIASVIGEIMLTGKSNLLDRDTAFLKKVMLVDDIFSETLRKTITEFVRKHKTLINTKIFNAGESNPFTKLTQDWVRCMNDSKFLAAVDSINIMSEISQVNHVVTVLPGKAEVVDDQRLIAMPFYGRICPYETPAGKKLGIVNTKAIGARVKDHLLYAPYRKVLQTNNGIRVSNKITWLSVKDEMNYKLGDILSLRTDRNGNYINNTILARIPNPEVSDEPYIVQNIRAFDLAGGYVQAYPEQFLSPTACLVPFAASDDPVRISYGLSQLRQAVYCLHSQPPRVKTPMYSDMFEYSSAITYRSACNGVVKYIDNMRAEIIDDDTNTVKTVYMQGSSHIGQLDATVSLLVKAGERVTENQALAEAHKYPQPYVCRAPYSGYIDSISDTKIVIKKENNSGWTDLEDSDFITISSSRILGQSCVFTNIHVSVGDYVTKSQILCDTYASRGGFYSPSRNPLVAYISTGFNYEDGVHVFERASVAYTSTIVHKIDERVSKRTYRYMNTSIPNGYRYIEKGETIGQIKCQKSPQGNVEYIRPIRATGKHNGILFEINLLEDDNYSRTYRFNMLGVNKLKSGDKMAGRHGNKGVASPVFPDSKAFQLLNGKTTEICLNPLGVPSRMNLGQILDASLGLVAEITQTCIDTECFNGATTEDVSYLLRYVWTLANTEMIGDNVRKEYNRAAFDAVCEAFPAIPAEYNEMVWKHIDNVIDWRGAFNPDGTAVLYDPETDTMLEGNVLIGYPMFCKLMQEADEKLNVRSGPLCEGYSLTSSQPQKGQGSAKGQRVAEMEYMCLAAMGANKLIQELLNERSDNAGARANNHMKALGLNDNLVTRESCYSRAVENLMYLLEACNVKVEVDDDIVDTSYDASRNKYVVDLKRLACDKFNPSTSKDLRPKTTVGDYYDMED